MRLLVAIALLLTWPGLGACTNGLPVASDSSGTPAALPASRPSAVLIRYLEPVNVDVRDVPVLMALDELQSRGYRIEKTQIAGPPLLAALLARGDADIAVTNNQTMWTAIAKGADIRTVVQFAGPTTVLAASKSITACVELDGKQMGVSGPAGLSQILIQIYLQRRCAGARPQLIVMAESSGRAAALLAGRLDAAVMPGEELIKLQLQAPGRLHALMNHSQEFPEIRIDSFHFRRAWMEQHPQGVRDFIRALLGAQRRITSDPELLYAEAQKRLPIDERTARAVAGAHLRMGIWDANGGLTPENLQYTLDFLVKAHALPEGLTVRRISDLSYLNDVLREIGRQDTVRGGT